MAGNGHEYFQEHQLVQIAIEFFSRKVDEMDQKQQLALTRIQDPRNRRYLKKALGAKDVQASFSNKQVQHLLNIFNDLFFFGSITTMNFSWQTTYSENESDGHWLAWTGVRFHDDETPYHRIEMRPTNPSIEVRLQQCIGVSPAAPSLRIGTLLHEMIHCFLTQFACQDCLPYSKYQGAGHGRGFQSLAKAIEEQAPQLLGLFVDLGRIDAVWADMNAKGKSIDRNKPMGPSAHDMEMYGFLAPLEKERAGPSRMGLLGRKRMEQIAVVAKSRLE